MSIEISDSVIANVVEVMLPRFSGSNLGLLVGLDMGLTDYGYGKDGNTKEREELNVRQFPWFLFKRDSNYTKMYFWMPCDDTKGLGISPLYLKDVVWKEVMDHDSCWREEIGTRLFTLYMKMSDVFRGRKISGSDLRPCDLSKHIYLQHQTPCYVKFDRLDSVHPQAERYSEESKQKIIKVHRVEFKDIQSDDKSRLTLRGV